MAISFDKGVVICKTYEKLDGRYFASFIDENFESMFAVADKSALRLWVQTEIQVKIQQWLAQLWTVQTVNS